MTTWRVADDDPTAAVVQLAIQRMGSATSTGISTSQIDHVVSYMTGQHWLATAADLRVALNNPTQWTALEVPVRLKLALEEVLQEWDTIQEVYPSAKWEQAAVYTGESAGEAVPNEISGMDKDGDASVESTDGSWRCLRCTYQNQYQDSFCVVCYEHYSVSVVLEAPVTPTAPDFDAIVCAMPIAEEIPPVPPMHSLGDVSPTPPPPIPLVLTATTASTPVAPSSALDDSLSEHFKALAFNKPPSPKSKPSPQMDEAGGVHSQRRAEPV
ncbi:hypothetical protein H310_12417 [Aphanomyces invadans]|uniref:RanBP2-type domain-containing protein n=1 Tax=Aphanomyces invadans TaxID=157072 RepID=A0A024TJV9_9STRA|nr:hypothetical protein H310_12417 [Aphanomyces invadans]ETV93647.1 hypothetical protein H310_12417 [Aphanomyces invadans]|eukprot:XP_008877688.1 hypothetical protein H310_12417 [Aphanomyces invadans]